MKVDILAFAAHPDDIELAACGTLMKHIAQGKIVAIVDLTMGQLGSRGSTELRLQEAEKAKEVLGVHYRENLGMEDGWFRNDPEHQLKVIASIRKYKPELVLCNAVRDRHPDHGRSSGLVSEACFYSGLKKIETDGLQPWRPRMVLHYIQDRYIAPDLVVDITDYIDRKTDAILSFGSQFYDVNSVEPETPISSKGFLEQVKGRSRDMGRYIGVDFGEGFTVERPVGIEDITALL